MADTNMDYRKQVIRRQLNGTDGAIRCIKQLFNRWGIFLILEQVYAKLFENAIHHVKGKVG